MPTFENRKRMTLAEAKERLVPIAESERVQHIVTNEDGSYSVVGHIMFAICDYCVEAAGGVTEHAAKGDIYQEISLAESDQGDVGNLTDIYEDGKVNSELPEDYFHKFEELLVAIAAKHPTKTHKLRALAAQVGRDYRLGGFMLVGRAMNGWDSTPWTPAEISKSDLRAIVIAELRHNAIRPKSEDSNHEGAFWRVGETVFDALFGHPADGYWGDQIVWSNLDKVSYADGGNPPQWLSDTQRYSMSELLKIEHKCFRPANMLITAGEGWFEHRFDYLSIEYSKLAALPIWTARWGETKIVIAEHPQGKPGGYDKFVEQVMAGFDSLK